MAFYIESGTGRQITDPSQADPNKFYVESGTGRQIPGSQLAPALSGTGTPPPNPAPSVAPSTPGGTLALPPSSGTGQGNLVTFADALKQAVDIARQNRNASAVDIASPYMGTVGAGSFADIVDALNKSSENRLTDISKTLSPDIVTATSDNGDVHGIDKKTGQVLWTAKGVGNRQSGANGRLTDAELKQQINKQIAYLAKNDPGWATATEDDKANYIRSLGGDPKDYLSSGGFQ